MKSQQAIFQLGMSRQMADLDGDEIDFWHRMFVNDWFGSCIKIIICIISN